MNESKAYSCYPLFGMACVVKLNKNTNTQLKCVYLCFENDKEYLRCATQCVQDNAMHPIAQYIHV